MSYKFHIRGNLMPYLSMNVSFLLLLGGILAGCKSVTNQLRPETIFQEPGAKSGAISKTTPESVVASLSFLASDELQGREAGSEGIEKAADYLSGYFKRYNISPYFPGYRDTLRNFEKPAFNIVGVLKGVDATLQQEYLLIGAHYDHIGKGAPINGDSIANGANDNASGVVAVLEIAKYFAQSHSNKRSLLFVLFSAEEEGLVGSEHLAQKLKTAGLPLYAMVNFEMIGVPMKTPHKAYITGYNNSNMAAKINEYAGKMVLGYLPEETPYQLFKRSDNYPFYTAFNIPAQTISTFDFNNYPYYHHVDDEVGQMDSVHMANLINELLPALEKMANAPFPEIKLLP